MPDDSPWVAIAWHLLTFDDLMVLRIVVAQHGPTTPATVLAVLLADDDAAHNVDLDTTFHRLVTARLLLETGSRRDYYTPTAEGRLLAEMEDPA